MIIIRAIMHDCGWVIVGPIGVAARLGLNPPLTRECGRWIYKDPGRSTLRKSAVSVLVQQGVHLIDQGSKPVRNAEVKGFERPSAPPSSFNYFLVLSLIASTASGLGCKSETGTMCKRFLIPGCCTDAQGR